MNAFPLAVLWPFSNFFLSPSLPQVTLDVSGTFDGVAGTLSISISNSFPIALFQFCIVGADGQPLPTTAAMGMQGVQFDTETVPSETAIVSDGSNEAGTKQRRTLETVLTVGVNIIIIINE